ncbi:MAG: hypothetical protein ACREKQ_00025 [Candidatus Rokuibacteriota bacterium]
MTVWDALTWVTVAVLGPGVLVICFGVARDLRRLLGPAAPEATPGPAPERRPPGP